jgi:hypothetical protein
MADYLCLRKNMASDMLIASLEKRIAALEQDKENFDSWKQQAEKEIVQLKGLSQHLIIRSELTLYTISAMINSGALPGISVERLIKDASFNKAEISDAIITKEKEIVLSALKKVTGL